MEGEVWGVLQRTSLGYVYLCSSLERRGDDRGLALDGDGIKSLSTAFCASEWRGGFVCAGGGNVCVGKLVGVACWTGTALLFGARHCWLLSAVDWVRS